MTAAQGSGAPPRRVFALTGRSRPLDPRTHAVRADIADVRLADRVFAPHYAEPVRRVLRTSASLRLDRSAGAEVVAALSPGESFDLLDVTGDTGWGIAVSSGLVGYLDADAFAPVLRA